MEKMHELLNLVNSYSGDKQQTERIKNLICYLSEKEDIKRNEDLRDIIFWATEKLRVFGYNHINKIRLDEISTYSELFDFRHEAIKKYYRSQSNPMAILDLRQKEIVDDFMALTNKRLLLSAPTSFGKTYILREILFLNAERYNNIVLIFPTIALLLENTKKIEEFVELNDLDYSVINNVNVDIDTQKRHIFILTPERALRLFADYSTLKIDFFFFDEVYKIDEDFNKNDEETQQTITEGKGFEEEDFENNESETEENISYHRATAFRITLYYLSKMVPEFYLAGPYLNLSKLNKGLQIFVDKNKITCKQIDFEPTLKSINYAWKKQGEEENDIEGVIPVEYDFNVSDNLSLKLHGILKHIKANDLGKTLVYCSNPANTLRYAKAVADLMPSFTSQERDVFSQHLRKRYNTSWKINDLTYYSVDKWVMLDLLNKGIGVHHGKFPKYIQKEILELYDNNDIDVLFCTSTLIEGVNTKAKNIIVLNNSIGRDTITPFAMKNIVGRAGRYYQHFIGRVFFVNEKQRDIYRDERIQLNFCTFDDKQLSNIDLDNTYLDDLSTSNHNLKVERDSRLKLEILPDAIFIKNRLFDRIKQEKLVEYVKENFKEFEFLLQNCNIGSFIKNKGIELILQAIVHAQLLSEQACLNYKSVAINYSSKGYKGLLRYQLKKYFIEENDLKKVDKAYLKAFEQVKTILEYEIPRFFALFEAIFAFVAEQQGFDVKDFSLQTIMRFFEIGVLSLTGVHLIERGLPKEAVEEIEKYIDNINKMTKEEGLEYISKNVRYLTSGFTQYERELLNKILNI